MGNVGDSYIDEAKDFTEIIEDYIDTALAELFSLDTVDFGQIFSLSNLYSTINNIVGVEYVLISQLTITPLVTYNTWEDDSAYVGAFVVASNIKEEIWTVNVTGASLPQTFNVSGSISGPQTSGIFDTEYTTDDGELTFTIIAGTELNKLGDYLTIETKDYLNSIEPDDNQIVQQGTINITYEGGLS